jgi:NAD(P)-dependent dehydrogenase (short-subunit alcohol dehydrogenase family)
MNIVITGTSSGIGRSLAEHLLARGHQVWGLARSDQAGFAQTHPEGFHSTRCDVADPHSVEAARDAIAAAWPHVDGLVACAGTHKAIGPAMGVPAADWCADVRANLDGTYLPIRAFAGLLRRTPRRAKIVCFSGGGATKARPGFSAYGVAKTAVVRLVETIAAEEADTALDINAIAPGAIPTPLTDAIIARGPEGVGQVEYDSAVRLKQAGAEALAKAIGLVDWLLSPASDGIRGRLIAAPWDPWQTLGNHATAIAGAADVYTLRRVLPEDRGLKF